jgi:hypothetical protein
MTSTPFYEFPISTPILGRGSGVSVTFTRPVDTTSYAAADVIGSATSAIHEFARVGRAGGLYQLLGASCIINSATVPTGMTTLKLHLLSSPPSAILDNAAFALTAADRNRYLAHIDFPAVAAVGAGFVRSAVDISGERAIATVGSSLFGLLVTDAAVTSPASALEFQLRVFLREIA